MLPGSVEYQTCPCCHISPNNFVCVTQYWHVLFLLHVPPSDPYYLIAGKRQVGRCEESLKFLWVCHDFILRPVLDSVNLSQNELRQSLTSQLLAAFF
jgi:hypothetical protein